VCLVSNQGKRENRAGDCDRHGDLKKKLILNIEKVKNYENMKRKFKN
jgi:hypothetical protein